jgi:hypothetical protein
MHIFPYCKAGWCLHLNMFQVALEDVFRGTYLYGLTAQFMRSGWSLDTHERLWSLTYMLQPEGMRSAT